LQRVTPGFPRADVPGHALYSAAAPGANDRSIKRY